MIEIRGLHKTYQPGDTPVAALCDVTLQIESGEFVAIMGPSGSGKSTLLHILGLLDVPDSGSYRLNGLEVSRLDEDELSLLRRKTIGLVFQQFHLLPRTSALENVELPMLYSRHRFDQDRAAQLLSDVGLAGRLEHRPNQLSGGQQQRVAIARALVNRPAIILADEPTGNLDSRSAEEILALLTRLNSEGITVILVTHEDDIARQARRIIRMKDGRIQSDSRLRPEPQRSQALPGSNGANGRSVLRIFDFMQHLRQGLRSLGANKVRSALSTLGILIGVTAVVAMLALGRGAEKSIQQQLAALGSNLLLVRPGAMQIGGVALELGAVSRLNMEDVEAVRSQLQGVKNISPSVMGRAQASYGNKNWSTQIQGVWHSYASMRAATPPQGRFFTEEENRQRLRVAVLGPTVVRNLFGDQNPVGESLRINQINFQIIGVLPERGVTGFRDHDDIILMPVFTAMHRLLGKDYFDSLDIEAQSSDVLPHLQDEVKNLLLRRHKVAPSQTQDAFEVRNMSDIRQAMSKASQTMGYLLATIAAISLLVGGIGIMNIMLVSVTERTREIGLRKAIGARQVDILLQFLTEAVVVSALGGCLGVALGWMITVILARWVGWTTYIATDSVVMSFGFSALVGLIFGLYPARKAARLNPIDALRHE